MSIKTTNSLNQRNDKGNSWVQRMKVLKMFKLDLRKLKSKMTTRKRPEKELLGRRRKRRRSLRNKEIGSTTEKARPIELMMETARVTCRNKFTVDSKVFTDRITLSSSIKSFTLIIWEDQYLLTEWEWQLCVPANLINLNLSLSVRIHTWCSHLGLEWCFLTIEYLPCLVHSRYILILLRNGFQNQLNKDFYTSILKAPKLTNGISQDYMILKLKRPDLICKQ